MGVAALFRCVLVTLNRVRALAHLRPEWSEPSADGPVVVSTSRSGNGGHHEWSERAPKPGTARCLDDCEYRMAAVGGLH